MSGLELRLRFPLADFLLDVDLHLPGRGVTALFGPSGSGKTSLLRCVAGLQRAHGIVRVNGDVWQNDEAGQFLPVHRRPLGYVFQEASLFPHLSVRGNLEFGLKRIASDARRVNWDVAIELLGIGHLLERSVARLSGGERQRVAIARALAQDAPALLLDEPTNHLDIRHQHGVQGLLRQLAEQGRTVVQVLHDLELAARYSDWVLLLADGELLAAGAPGQALSAAALTRAYQWPITPHADGDGGWRFCSARAGRDALAPC